MWMPPSPVSVLYGIKNNVIPDPIRFHIYNPDFAPGFFYPGFYRSLQSTKKYEIHY
jgi:hypothetical protein